MPSPSGQVSTRDRFLSHGVRSLVAAFVVLLVPAGSVRGQCFVEEQKLTANDGQGGDNFGCAVALDGDVLVVGARFADCATVYRHNGSGWVFEDKLVPLDGEAGDDFGRSVALSGDTIVVGSPQHGCASAKPCGASYVFRRIGADWVEEQKLTGWDITNQGWFGIVVAASQGTILVGAPWAEHGGNTFGAAYLFRFDGTEWIEDQKLVGLDPGYTVVDRIGWSVSLDNGVALVGAPLTDCSGGHDCGAAYLYRFDGTKWVEEQILRASDAAFSQQFGRSVAVHGDRALIGAPTSVCGSGCGASYVFHFDGETWVEAQKLTAQDGDVFLGTSVSLSTDTGVVGSFARCADGSACGSAYVSAFDGAGIARPQRLTASDARSWDEFGVSVAASGQRIVIGAVGADCDKDEYCGAAYVFRDVGPVPAFFSFPPSGSTLPRVQKNIIRVELLDAPPTGVGPGDIEIVEMLEGGGYGEDVSGSFSIDESDGVITIQDTGATLANKTWYRVRTTGNNGCIDFDLCLLVQMGDAGEDRFVNWANDMFVIYALIPTLETTTDRELRADINGDGFINFADMQLQNSFVPALPVAVPEGHTCP